MNARKNSLRLFLQVILPLTALWLVLRYLFLLPLDVTTLVVVIATVIGFLLWNRREKRAAIKPEDER